MEPGESGCSVPCKTQKAHIVHKAWTRGRAGWGPILHGAGGGLCCSASPNCASLGKAASRARQGCSVPERGACKICTRSGFCLVCSLKRQAGVANYWPLYKALKLSAMEIALSDPNFRFSRTESLTHCAVTSTRMSWPAWSPSAPSSWPSASRHREASPCHQCQLIFEVWVPTRQSVRPPDLWPSEARTPPPRPVPGFARLRRRSAWAFLLIAPSVLMRGFQLSFQGWAQP